MRRSAAPSRDRDPHLQHLRRLRLQQRHAPRSAAGRRDIGAGDSAAGPYDDQIAFMRDAGALAESLLSEGFTAMKIWPLDIQAAASGGQMITLSDLKAGLEPFRKIRAAVGDRIEVMCELHSLWSSHAAIRICRALEDLGIFWAEDPIAKMGDFKALADLRRRRPACRSAAARRWAAPSPSARCWKPRRSISSCSTSPGAAG